MCNNRENKKRNMKRRENKIIEWIKWLVVIIFRRMPHLWPTFLCHFVDYKKRNGAVYYNCAPKFLLLFFFLLLFLHQHANTTNGRSQTHTQRERKRKSVKNFQCLALQRFQVFVISYCVLLFVLFLFFYQFYCYCHIILMEKY